MISLFGSTIEFSGGSKPRIASDVTDLPDPDSPTSASVLSLGMSNEMPFTASNVVCLSRRNETRRLRTLTNGSISCSLLRSAACAAFEFRIEGVAESVGEERECRHQYRHCRTGRGELPPFAEDQFVLRLVQHRAP